MIELPIFNHAQVVAETVLQNLNLDNCLISWRYFCLSGMLPYFARPVLLAERDCRETDSWNVWFYIRWSDSPLHSCCFRNGCRTLVHVSLVPSRRASVAG